MKNSVIIGVYTFSDHENSNFLFETDTGSYEVWLGGYKRTTRLETSALREFLDYNIRGLKVDSIRFDSESAALKFTNGNYLIIGLNMDLMDLDNVSNNRPRNINPAEHFVQYLDANDVRGDTEFLDWFENDLEE